MHTQPFSELTPDAVLDALDSVGLRSDGRLLALNSYENRVYQAGMEDGPSADRQVLPLRTLDGCGHSGRARICRDAG